MCTPIGRLSSGLSPVVRSTRSQTCAGMCRASSELRARRSPMRVSSRSCRRCRAHRDDVRPDATEDDDVYEPPFPDTEEIREDTYGPLKVASEVAVRDAFGDRALIVRPGLIIGPNDPTDRFTYWVRRVAAGGEVLIPGPPDYPVQWIDARDLAAFLLSLCERGVGVIYSVVRPPVPI